MILIVTDSNNELKNKIPLFFLDNNRQYSNQKIVEDFGINFHNIKEAFQKTKEYYESINQNTEGNYGLRISKEKAISFGYFLD
ncbi:MAG: anti-sigma regulatory factor (Ser/Thr protein kinase) [Maribacter sp.]|jgi:anti-sigma regulatory factor (Ser/Thr protein kinase)